MGNQSNPGSDGVLRQESRTRHDSRREAHYNQSIFMASLSFISVMRVRGHGAERT